MSDLGRIATLIENRYREHSAEARRIWGLKGDGPRLAAEVDSEDEASFTLRGRSRTLANRRFHWPHLGGDGTLLELLGHKASAKPLDRKLADVSMVQAIRAAVAKDMGAGTSSVPAGRILIDRFAATRVATRNSVGMLHDIVRAARASDGDEPAPHGQITMANAGTMQFGVAPCEVDLTENTVRRPQVRMPAIELPGLATYIHSRLQITGATLPETLAIAATGRRLGDVVDTGEAMLADRTVKAVTRAGDTLMVILIEDMVEIGELTG